ncbi:MAG: dihydroorotate dehydrogenase [Candidatus Goldiibacteriota bacterium HGW-Goldbacteria-1]|jgi:dihydroorotate dehydrogenase (NAD+) catalytic subunit|nr:MAG: dihydroorotate dehydrogenase [Candidatus Goldiibacteriota bacterium HGW-Goldbacteria-1]
MKINTTVNIGGLVLKNPVMTASGTFGYGLEFEEYVNLNKLGAIVVKGIALNPVKGNKPQRIVETPAGIMNAIGLQNVGVEAFISEKLPLLKKYSTPVIANIYGTDVDGYIKVAQRLNDSATAGVEINISCPNVKKGGLQFASDKEVVSTMIKEIKKVFTRPVIVKLSPNTGNIEEMAQVCEDSGADAVSLINTLIGLSINLKTRRPNIANVFGGLSGPAIKPVALAMVHKVSKKIKIPIIGIGGIMNTTDALEFLVAGASAVQIGTANFVDPSITGIIADGIKNYLEDNKINSVTGLIGTLEY